MIKTARQLKDLIRNLSREKSADAQILMRNYMMERFLERISLSEYRDKFILKGGMLVAAMVGLDARSTMDLDATIKGANVNVEDIENLISSIVTVPIDDGVKFQLKSISEIMDEAEYPGIRVSMSTTFDGVVTPLKIDISTGDAITPREVRYSFKLMLEDRSIDISVSYTHLSTGGVHLGKGLRRYELYESAYRKNKRRTGRRAARRDLPCTGTAGTGRHTPFCDC